MSEPQTFLPLLDIHLGTIYDGVIWRFYMRAAALVLILFCPAWSTFASEVQGTVPMPQEKSNSSPQVDGCFWRLGPVAESKPEAYAPVVVLEKTDSNKTSPSGPIKHIFMIKGYSIDPPLIALPPNSTIVFENKDQHPYSCFAEGPSAFQFTELQPGESSEQKTVSKDLLQVRCHLYPFMSARIFVNPASLITQVDDSYRFTFPKVQAGNYRLRVHARGSWQWTRDIQVPPRGTLQVDLSSAAPAIATGKDRGFQETKPAVAEKEPASIIPKPEKKPASIASEQEKKAKVAQEKKDNQTKLTPAKKPGFKRSPPPEKKPAQDIIEPSFNDVEPEIEIIEEE